MQLVKKINVAVDRFIELMKRKINLNFLKVLVIIVIIFLFIDCIASAIAIEVFLSRVVIENNIENAQNIDSYKKIYELFYENFNIRKFVDKYWNEKKMILTYPNLKLQLNNEKQLYVQDFYKEVKPYYYKFKNNVIDVKL